MVRPKRIRRILEMTKEEKTLVLKKARALLNAGYGPSLVATELNLSVEELKNLFQEER